MLDTMYTPEDWFWIVAGKEKNGAWSTAARAYVSKWPEDRVSRIASEVELVDVLIRAGLSSRAPKSRPSSAELLSAIERIDAGLVAEAFGGSLPKGTERFTVPANDPRLAAAIESVGLRTLP
jgi:hypothetical protein